MVGPYRVELYVHAYKTRSQNRREQGLYGATTSYCPKNARASTASFTN